MFQITKKKTAAMGAFIGAVLVANIAFAAWTANGSGSGQANSGSGVGVTSAGATVPELLYPNGSADVRLTITNTNPYKVEVTNINNAATPSILSGDSACDASHGVTFANQSGSWFVPANGSLKVELSNAASMSNASVNACQGKAFTISVALTAGSTASTATTADAWS